MHRGLAKVANMKAYKCKDRNKKLPFFWVVFQDTKINNDEIYFKPGTIIEVLF